MNIEHAKYLRVVDELLKQCKFIDERECRTFASTHEMMGVLGEEFSELAHEVHMNDLERTKAEALDTAVVLIRWLAQQDGQQ